MVKNRKKGSIKKDSRAKDEKTCHIVVEDLSPFDEKKYPQELLELLYNHLKSEKSILLFSEDSSSDDKNFSDDEEKILYHPYESFQKNKKWTAGRFIGDVTIDLSDKKGKLEKGLYHLEIKPRFGFRFLIHMLECIYNFRMPESERSIGESRASWNDCLQLFMRFLWVARFAKADKYGLPRKTIKRINYGIQIRGHLNVRRSIISLKNEGKAFSEYYEKDVDETVGRIVYKAYEVLSKNKSKNLKLPPQVQESVNDLYTRYHGQPFIISDGEYQKIQYKSIYESWKPLVDFSWQIIHHKNIDPHSSVNGKGYSLFFDIAEIWEAYIAKLLKKSFTHFTSNNSNIFLFENDSEENFQKIIPDYISNDYRIGGKQEVAFATAVGDAKYMDLKDIKNLPAEKASAVYYKTIMYMQRFNCNCGFLFYPISREYKENEDYTKVRSESQIFKIVGTKSCITKIGLNVFHTEDEKINNDDSYTKLIVEQENSFVDMAEKKLTEIQLEQHIARHFLTYA